MSGLYQIDKLEDNSYDSWSIQMRSVLVHSGLWSLTSGELTATNAPEGVDWSARDQKALATITLSVKTSQLAYIKNCQSSSEAWEKLKEVHQTRGPVRKVKYKKLLGKRMGHAQNISSYINEFLEGLDGLISVEIDLNEELRTIVLQSSLSEQFENFVVAIETRDELPSFETFCIKLKEEGEPSFGNRK